jgi:3',5'-cyclic AMP phosphodiesterase CpdA
LGAIRILHISDTHFPIDLHPSQLRICEALVEKVSNLQSERRFDVIAFTGDVSYSGATEEFEVAKLNLIAPLISACHLGLLLFEVTSKL